ncbi:hypothetical protein FPQ18DRAFT_261297 [Pyronema domesticum]|nr:hypothetical protein FPQ18DRAFT_261297 [Pyronema domesticum]
MDLEGDAEIHVPKKLQKAAIVRAPSPVDENPGFFMDLDGDSEVHVPKKLQKPPVVRQSSPANSISSDGSEKIVFVPRSNRGRPPPTPKTQPSNASTTLNAPITPKSMPPTPKPVVASTIVQSRTVTTSITVSGPSTKAKEVSPADNYIQLNGQTGFNGQRATPASKRPKSKGKGKAPASSKSADQEAYDDYVENVAATMLAEAKDDPYNELLKDPIFAALRKRDLGDEDGNDASTDDSGDEGDEAEDDAAIEAYKNGWDSDHIPYKKAWDAENLRELEDLSTDYEGSKGFVSRILLKRKRPSGLQYLIKWDGYDTDDASWIHEDNLDSSADVKTKDSDEEEDSEEDSEDDDEDDDGDTEDDDRKLAILLQMQEDGMMAVDNFTELEELDDDFFPMGVGKKSKKQKKSKKSLLDIEADPYTGRYPSASKMAAQFDKLDEFDVMDWERPSLTMGKKKKKGKGYQGDLEGIDPELREQIGNAWHKDRVAKKLRKIQREEVRAQGLLGVKAQKTGKADLKEKYARGMTMTQVFDEIRQFMLRDHSSLALPPMTKHDRKTVHDLAAKFNLKSKSIGKGNSRFTTIIKTSRSSSFEYNEEAVDSILRHGKFLKRMDKSAAQHLLPKRASGAGPQGKLRDGMVVGESASELSADNKGRLMLEKMGYKTGMTLGVDGRGIAEPLMAIMKTGKAGLQG